MGLSRKAMNWRMSERSATNSGLRGGLLPLAAICSDFHLAARSASPTGTWRKAFAAWISRPEPGRSRRGNALEEPFDTRPIIWVREARQAFGRQNRQTPLREGYGSFLDLAFRHEVYDTPSYRRC
jgi:hypothetical protein